MIFFSLFSLLLLSIPAFVNIMARFWETIPRLQTEQILEVRPQAIVILGGGMKRTQANFSCGAELSHDSLVRVLNGARLARDTGLPLLVAGGRVLNHCAVSEAELMADILEQDFGLSVTWREDQSLNTAENARYCGQLLRRIHINRIILVTQAFHMPRALEQFNRTGFTVLAAPVDFFSGEQEFSVRQFVPSLGALTHSVLLIHEWIGCYWYRYRYA